MSTETIYADEIQEGLSGNIWKDCPFEKLGRQPGAGMLYVDDFQNFSQHISDQSTQEYDSFIDTGVTMKQLAGVVDGVMEMSHDGTANDEAVLSGHGPMAQVSDTAGENKKLWFECRIKKASIADNALAFFAGLAFDHGSSVPVSKADCLVDSTGALGAFSFLGFHVDQANGDSIDFVYKAEGQAQTVAISGLSAMVADTYIKLGFLFDPAAPSAKRLKVFVDNVEHDTKITATNIAAATFPDAEPLTPVLASKVGSGASATTLQCDWIAVAQLR